MMRPAAPGGAVEAKRAFAFDTLSPDQAAMSARGRKSAVSGERDVNNVETREGATASAALAEELAVKVRVGGEDALSTFRSYEA